jgi:hypothetical protein
MSRKLRRCLLVLAVALLSLSGEKALASHAMGADLTYECLEEILTKYGFRFTVIVLESLPRPMYM